MARTLTFLTLCAATLASAAEPPTNPAATPAPGSGPVDPAPPIAPERPRPPPARTIVGTVRAFEASPPRVTIDLEEGKGEPLTVAVDRNTAVYLASGLGTVRDLRAGEPVRGSVSGGRVLWIELTRTDAPDSPATSVSPPTVPPGEVGGAQGPVGPGSTVSPGTAPATPPATPGR
jgi:hypothetical protein